MKKARPLLSLAIRAGKVVILIMGLIGVLAEMGYPVGSMLATLGIGGLAFALAAQKTIENVFGSVSIGMDQPMREGEFVRIDDFVATVEAIGLRSSRFRTLDRTVITIPNGKLADMKVETFAARDRIRLATTLGLVYSTTAEQMLATLEELHHSTPVLVFTLAYGADADVATLQSISSATGAHYYDATDPTEVDEVLGDLVTSF